MKQLLAVLFGLFLAVGVVIPEAEAKRLGGARSLGMQRDAVTQRQAVPPAKQPQQAAQTPGATQQPAGNRWLAPLAGLAAGLGLAALLGSEGAGAIALILLMAAAAFVVLALVRRSMAPRPATANGGPLAYNGLGNETVVAPPPSQQVPAGYSPEQHGPAQPRIPAGFDVDAFLRQAKRSFIELQAANDRGDMDAIRDLVADELLSSLEQDIRSRRESAQATDIVTLDAELLEVVTEGTTHWASIRFSGMLREDAGGVPTHFEEVWNLRKAASGDGGWLLAGIQQLG